jgi:hypothetical protein
MVRIPISNGGSQENHLVTKYHYIYIYMISPIIIYYDNQNAIKLNKYSTYHNRIKHFSIHLQFTQ